VFAQGVEETGGKSFRGRPGRLLRKVVVNKLGWWDSDRVLSTTEKLETMKGTKGEKGVPSRMSKGRGPVLIRQLYCDITGVKR